MRAHWHSFSSDAGTVRAGAAVVGVTVYAWIIVIGQSAHAMAAGGIAPSLGEAGAFTAMWGVMMAAMMLPSAAPMILLYRTVSARLRTPNDRAIPAALFAGAYLLVWLLLGIPVYAASAIAGSLNDRAPAFRSAGPYVVGALLAAAGLYQLSPLKRRCLRVCEAPLLFLMRRWRNGYGATLRLAFTHAVYCLGCCWALMAILVAAGAMSLSWVVLITALVFAEKMFPYGERTARTVGFSLILLGIAVAVHPPLVSATRWNPGASMPEMRVH